MSPNLDSFLYILPLVVKCQNSSVVFVPCNRDLSVLFMFSSPEMKKIIVESFYLNDMKD